MRRTFRRRPFFLPDAWNIGFCLALARGRRGNKKIKISKDVSLSDLALQFLAQHSLKLVTAAGWSRLHAFFQRLFFSSFRRWSSVQALSIVVTLPPRIFHRAGYRTGTRQISIFHPREFFFFGSFLENVEINTFFRWAQLSRSVVFCFRTLLMNRTVHGSSRGFLLGTGALTHADALILRARTQHCNYWFRRGYRASNYTFCVCWKWKCWLK